MVLKSIIFGVILLADLHFVSGVGLGDACTAATDCKDVDSSYCKETMCACSEGYTEDVDACVKVYGSDCTGNDVCEGLAHSACTDEKCDCASGYVESNNICSPESGAVSMKSTVGLVVGSVIVLLIQAL